MTGHYRMMKASPSPGLRQYGVGRLRFLGFGFILFFGLCHLPVLGQSSESGSDPLSIVQALHAAMEGNDSEVVLDLLDDEVQWIVHGPQYLIRYAGEHRGRIGVQRYLSRAMQTREVLDGGYSKISVDGDVVTALGWERGSSRETGGEFLATKAQFITVQDGAVVRFEEVLDSAEIAEALMPADAERGRAYYSSCVACHGTNGEGNYSMHGSNLTVLDGEYLLRQMRNYRNYARGGVTDFYGWQMNGRAIAMPSDRALRDLVAFIDTLPDFQASKTIEGNVSKGKKIYEEQCAFCHGSRGEGVAELGASRLSGLEDWYQLDQLENYRNGIRGVADGDTWGQQMRPYAEALADDTALRDVVSYIATLGDK